MRAEYISFSVPSFAGLALCLLVVGALLGVTLARAFYRGE